MKIVNWNRGLHKREVAGIEKLKRLPETWTCHTNLDLSLPGGEAREIDAIIILDDRILLLDLKDWHGRIESSNGRWQQNGVDRGSSPVGKIQENARKLAPLLKNYVASQLKGRGRSAPAPQVPLIQGFVVLTANPDVSGIAAFEREAVHYIDPFIRMLQNPANRREKLGETRPLRDGPLTEPTWRKRLQGFFKVEGSVFVVGERQYGPYRALRSEPTFAHRSGVFAEFDAEDRNANRAPGLLRLWDFTKVDTRFQTEDGRKEIAGRERLVTSQLIDLVPDLSSTVLQQRQDDQDRGVGYWEVFERHSRLKRLSDFVVTEAERSGREARLDLARQIIAQVSALHELDAAHLDLGAHSIWLETPSTVRLSHLFAASIPDIRTLGDQRFQFLTSVKLPEDVMGLPGSQKRKDVFLLGAAVHHLLFSQPPVALKVDDVPEWNADVDAKGVFANLHDWFAQALDIDPSNRFADAGEALQTFNMMAFGGHSLKAAIEGLERFRSIKSQMQLYKALPSEIELRDDDRVAMWRTTYNGRPALAKMWKRALWGDTHLEAPRIYDFLERVDSHIQAPLPGVAQLRNAIWLIDGIVVVRDWHDLPCLSEAIDADPGFWAQPTATLGFALRLAQVIDTLHSTGVFHGDLKPQNILVSESDGPTPLLIDLFDFAPAADGEMLTTAYAPATGGPQERDNYAVTKITEELLARCDYQMEGFSDVQSAIALCRNGPPENATLLPFIEAIERALAPPPPAASRQQISIGLLGAEAGSLLPDEGVFGLRFAPDRPTLFIRGAIEEIAINLNREFRPLSGRRRRLDQVRIAGLTRHEFKLIDCDVEVVDTPANDFQGLSPLLEDPDVQAAWQRYGYQADGKGFQESREETENEIVEEYGGDLAEDVLAEEIAAEPESDAHIDVPTLWRQLIDVERTLTIEGVAIGDSIWREKARRHLIPFQLDLGTFEFNREDRVLVERWNDRKKLWMKVGVLDVTASSPAQLLIDASLHFPDIRDKLIRDEDRLRFQSHFEIQSRTRREAATSRILGRLSTIRNLVDLFNPLSGAEPVSLQLAVNRAEISNKYSLNKDQADAFEHLLGLRPLNLVQGPPGTGKTRFIAALVHYALTNGLARNVLIASQSHEAVNNAAEKVLELFELDDGSPSIIRVGQEGAVSEPLLPYHAAQVERLYKDRFRAQFKTRMRISARALGLSAELADSVSFVERVIRPIAERLEEVAGRDTDDQAARASELIATLVRLLSKIGVNVDVAEYIQSNALLDEIIAAIQSRHPQVSPDAVAKFRSVVRIGRDFVNCVSTELRSFETFLAGTRQIVAGTCVGLGRSALGLIDTQFDLVVIDEAARCTASELAVPMQAGKWIVLVGDQAQLEPQHKPEVVSKVGSELRIPKGEILRSDFERLYSSKYGQAVRARLRKQYRMLPPIGRIVSTAFYGDLSHGRSQPKIPLDCLPDELSRAVSWIDTDCLGETAFQKEPRTGRKSLVNPKEADIIVAMLQSWDTHQPFKTWLGSRASDEHVIGVICTYAAQRDLLRRRLVTSGVSEALQRVIKIGTVDSYQGKENLIIILSLVRNNADGPKVGNRPTIREGFMSRPNRINVAFSRAMDRLLVVGARARWPKGGPMGKVSAAFISELEGGEATALHANEILNKLASNTRSRASIKDSVLPDVKRG